MEGLSELDRLILLRDTTNAAIRDLKAKDRAVKAEFECDNNRTGIRGGKFTTIAANAMNRTSLYFKGLELIKLISNEL